MNRKIRFHGMMIALFFAGMIVLTVCVVGCGAARGADRSSSAGQQEAESSEAITEEETSAEAPVTVPYEAYETESGKDSDICIVKGCDNPRTGRSSRADGASLYCDEHECDNCVCVKPRLNGYEYCEYHWKMFNLCKVEGCSNLRSEKTDLYGSRQTKYCDEHVCQEKWCIDEKDGIYSYCYKHREQRKKAKEAQETSTAAATKSAGSRYRAYTRNSSSNPDPYDVDDYDDPDDFADEWEEEFEDYDDAYDYWEDNH